MEELATTSLRTNDKDTIEMEPVVNVSTQQPSHTNQPLRKSQCGDDAVDHNLNTFEIPRSEREDELKTDMPAQPPSHAYQPLIKSQCRSSNEAYQDLKTPTMPESQDKPKPMTDMAAQNPPHAYQPLIRGQCSSSESYQDAKSPVIPKSEDETLPRTDMQKNPRAYQPLLKTQSSSKKVYQDLKTHDQLKPEVEYEAEPMTKMQSFQIPEYQSVDSIYDDVTVRVAGQCDAKAIIMKKMKMILTIVVTISVVVILFFVTAIAIVGGILIQSKLEELTDRQNLLTNQNSELSTVTFHNISLVSTHLFAANSNIQAHLFATNSNIISIQANVADLQEQITLLRTQLRHPCGPGWWHQVAYLNMSDPSQQCPPTWREYNTSGVRACGRPSASGGSCAVTTYSINFQFSKVCGRVIGYQFGSPDGFINPILNINERYADGISITRGSPREHVWTYAAGATESSSAHSPANCPCSSNPGRQPPSFVGDDYYCESGNPTNSQSFASQLFTSDKLWDGIQCEDSCCTDTDTPPWFNVQQSNTTSDNIEIRICGDEATINEDTPVELIEIYAAQ